MPGLTITFQAERNRPAVEPLPCEWPTHLKTAEPAKWHWDDGKLPAVALKAVPTTERPAEMPTGESVQLKRRPKKREGSEERQARLIGHIMIRMIVGMIRNRKCI